MNSAEASKPSRVSISLSLARCGLRPFGAGHRSPCLAPRFRRLVVQERGGAWSLGCTVSGKDEKTNRETRKWHNEIEEGAEERTRVNRNREKQRRRQGSQTRSSQLAKQRGKEGKERNWLTGSALGQYPFVCLTVCDTPFVSSLYLTHLPVYSLRQTVCSTTYPLGYPLPTWIHLRFSPSTMARLVEPIKAPPASFTSPSAGLFSNEPLANCWTSDDTWQNVYSWINTSPVG